MTMGTATVASTKVRSTGVSTRSQSPSSRLMTVRVGNTASQIMRASWCLLGGPTGGGVRDAVGAGTVGGLDMAELLEWLEVELKGAVGTGAVAASGSGREAVVEVVHGG